MRLLLFCALLLSGPPAIFAEEAVDPTPGQVHAWIEMLDAPKYGDRTEATTKLFRSGSRAIDALEATIRRGSREASDRAISILKAHYDNDDGILKEARSCVLGIRRRVLFRPGDDRDPDDVMDSQFAADSQLASDLQWANDPQCAGLDPAAMIRLSSCG